VDLGGEAVEESALEQLAHALVSTAGLHQVPGVDDVPVTYHAGPRAALGAVGDDLHARQTSRLIPKRWRCVTARYAFGLT
jgi:hypothetical protein